MSGAPKESGGYIKRKFKVEIPQDKLHSIESARKGYEQFLKLNNNTSNRAAWASYDHITADLFNEVMNDIMKDINKDLDKFCEKVIYDEFQLN